MSNGLEFSGGIEARPVRLRKRGDLVVQPMRGGVERVWRIKDPIALSYFELTDQEYAILEMLDGEISLAGLRYRFEEQFAPKTVDSSQIQAYLGELRAAGLVIDDVPGLGGAWAEQRSQHRRRERWQRWLNVFAWRFRGFNPTRVLDGMVVWIEAIPRSVWMIVLALFPTAALLVVALNPTAVRERFPAGVELLAPGFLVWLWLGVGLSRCAHELAHALTCRLRGGECPEVGIMLLMFTPCLYCDVSDTWLMPDRCSRLLISAAGMIAELEIAAACLLVWWFTEPGGLHSMALSLALVCSVNTLFLNGNPLLRYDGYYLLSDAMDEPNLGRKGDEFWRFAVRRAVLGLPSRVESAGLVRRPRFVAVYGALAAIYRPIVLVIAAWGICLLLSRIDQRELGIAAAWLLVIAMVLEPTGRIVAALSNPAWRHRVDRRRLSGWVAGTLILIAIGMLLPLPRRVAALAIVDAPSAAQMYVTVEGRLVEAVAEGTDVAAGTTLARLENPAMRREIIQYEAEVSQLEYRLKQNEALRGSDPRAAAAIPAVVESLSAAQRRLAERRRDYDRLRIEAPIAGRFLSPSIPRESDSPNHLLPTWQGRPLDRANLGCWMSRGTLLGQIGDPTRLEISLRIEPGDIDLIRSGQTVRVRLAQVPGIVYQGEVTEVGTQPGLYRPDDADLIPDAIGTRNHRDGHSTAFWARVRLNEATPPLLLRDTGEARISTNWVPLLPRMWRFLRQTFRIPSV